MSSPNPVRVERPLRGESTVVHVTVTSIVDRLPSVGKRAGGAAVPVVFATVILFLVSPLIVPGSLGRGPLATMLPFAAALALTAIGQTLVIQQGGVDFSVAGTVSLCAVLLTKYADGDDDRVLTALSLVVGVAVLIGVANGLLVTRLRIAPIVATLGVNAVVVGFMFRYSGGLSVPPAPPSVKEICLGKLLGLPNPIWFAFAVAVVASLVLNKTVGGRRFEAGGSNGPAALIAGIAVKRQTASSYVFAAVLYAGAGVLLAGFLNAPRIDAGDPYLLGSIAATVIGGTSLAGGRGSAMGAFFGALFLTQLGQLLLGLGWSSSVNLVVQGAVIAASMAIRTGVESAQRAKTRRESVQSAETKEPLPVAVGSGT